MTDEYDVEMVKRAYEEMARRARETDEDMGLSRGWTGEPHEDAQKPGRDRPRQPS